MGEKPEISGSSRGRDEIAMLIEAITRQAAMLGLNTAIASAHRETGSEVGKDVLMNDFEYLKQMVSRLGEAMVKTFEKKPQEKAQCIIKRGHLRLIK